MVIIFIGQGLNGTINIDKKDMTRLEPVRVILSDAEKI